MNKITLNKRELDMLTRIFKQINECDEYGHVVLERTPGSIGSTLTATFMIIHNNVAGNFTTTITNENDW